MDNPSINTLLIILVLISSVVTAFLVLFLRKRSQKKPPTPAVEAAGPRVLPRFVGRRTYSLALRGKYKLIMRALSFGVGAMPVVVLTVLGTGAFRHSQNTSALSNNLWVFTLVLIAWSASTVLFLRMMFKRRQGTKVILSAEGVRYTAPKVGFVSARDTMIPWDQIEKVASQNPQHPSLITASSPAGSFSFDSLQAHEISAYPIDGIYMSLESGNDLYRDLLEYSGLQPQVGPLKSRAPVSR